MSKTLLNVLNTEWFWALSIPRIIISDGSSHKEPFNPIKDGFVIEHGILGYEESTKTDKTLRGIIH